jgi:glycosyltransferase involved in cell wall biosynthesis
MNTNYNISVIIPAYNVERFIEKAIRSALEQPEVIEVIVVDDGSKDNTLQIVTQLQNEFPIIKLYHHPKKVNKGRSASRNLGIQKAKGDFIAFLDADDYYLPNRFTNDIRLFKENPNCDGLYNAVGFYFYRPATELELQTHQLYTVRHKVAPEELFENLFYGKCGHFHINGLTVKKSVFEVTGLFNEELIVAEDSEMFWRMAIKCRLETGVIDQAVAIRGVHDANVYNRVDLYEIYTMKMYESLLKWCSNHKVAYEIKDDLLKMIWILKHKENNKLYKDIVYWGKLFLPNFKLLFSILSIKYFPVIRYRQMLFPFLYT